MMLINLLVRILCLTSSYTISFFFFPCSILFKKKNIVLITNKLQKKFFIKKRPTNVN